MNNLIAALIIFQKYVGDVTYPTHCEHDKLVMCLDITPDMISEEDLQLLERYGFFWDNYDDYFCSYKYGSC